jgi:uncharacterized protein GlcG (DUF336 family)
MKAYLALPPTLAAVALSGAALAQAPAAPPGPPAPPARGPSLELSIQAAETAAAACAANGYKVAVSIVDSGGVLKVLHAADGASSRAVDSSTKKAQTALVFKMPTSEVAAKVKTDEALAAKLAVDTNLFARAGGLPLMAGNDLIGAIGVGGAPGGEKDEACATAAVDKIKAGLK